MQKIGKNTVNGVKHFDNSAGGLPCSTSQLHGIKKQ